MAVADKAGGDELIAEWWVLKSGSRVGISEMQVADREGKLSARPRAL